MAKIKHKVARYQVALNELQKKMLDEMMKEDAQTEISGFFGIIVVNEYKRRQELKAKRPQGRPRKERDDEANEDNEPDPFDYSDDVPKSIPYYGEMIGPREYADKMALQAEMRPKG